MQNIDRRGRLNAEQRASGGGLQSDDDGDAICPMRRQKIGLD
jgi:hypothetical protein